MTHISNGKELSKGPSLCTEVSFFSKAMHELRNQIHGINGITEFLNDNWDQIDDLQKKQNLKTIKSSSNVLNELIDSMFHLSAISVDKITLSFRKVDLLPVLQRVIEETNLSIPKNKQIIIKLDYDMPSYIIAVDIFWITRVIKNILINAIKYSSEGIIKVSLNIIYDNNQKYLQCSVKDHGIGVLEKDLKNIFMPFYQSSQNSNFVHDKIGGLGLAICNEVITRHEGKIVAENNINDRGLTIRFNIPIDNDVAVH